MLNQPYPVTESSYASLLLTGLLGGGLVAFTLIVFQPFGTDTVDFPYKNLFLAGYGLIVAASYWIMALIPARFFTGEKWVVWKQLLMVAIAVLLAVSASYFYLLLLGGNPTWRSYRNFAGNAMSVAIFPVIVFTLVDFTLKFRKYDQGAKAFTADLPKAPTKPTVVSEQLLEITDDQDRPVLELPTQRIWCLRSDRNYVDIFHLDAEDNPRKTTIRNTLTKLETALPASFLRCHRSHIVNSARVMKVTGNAQGYRLHDAGFPEMPVPVARGKSSEVMAFIRE